MKALLLTNLRITIAAVAVFVGLIQSSQAAGPDLYVTDNFGSVFEFAPDGSRITFATGLDRPTGLAFDSSGDLFVSESDTGIIYKYDSFGVQSVFATGLTRPFGLTFDTLGNLFVADFGTANFINPDGAIYKFTATGTRSTFASGLLAPVDLAFSPTGDLFVADFGRGSIYEFNPLGVETLFANVPRPEGLAFDAAGDLFATIGQANGSRTITKFNAAGMGTLFAGGLNNPGGLAFDMNGDLFDAESGIGEILKFDSGGNSTVFASGVGTPVFLAFGPTSNVMVPEPSTISLIIVGACGILCRNRLRKKV